MRRRVDLDNPRDSEIVLAVMEHLNSKKDYSEHLYDYGELGLLHIYWDYGKWRYNWLTIDPRPDQISDFVEIK